MSSALHRTSLEFRGLVNTPDFDTGTWVINPDMSPVDGEPKKYWVLTGDVLSVMDQAGKDVVDAADAATTTATAEASVKGALAADPLTNSGLSAEVAVSGLTLTCDIDNLVENDVTTVVADGTDTKTVMLCYLYNRDTDTLYMKAYEKTTGLYDDMLLEEELIRCFGQWTVVANGTDLVEV